MMNEMGSTAGNTAENAAEIPKYQLEGAIESLEVHQGRGVIRGTDGSAYKFHLTQCVGGADFFNQLSVGTMLGFDAPDEQGRITNITSEDISDHVSVMSDVAAHFTSAMSNDGVNQLDENGHVMHGEIERMDTLRGTWLVVGTDGKKYNIHVQNCRGRADTFNQLNVWAKIVFNISSPVGADNNTIATNVTLLDA